jgi:hypothetical protein
MREKKLGFQPTAHKRERGERGEMILVDKLKTQESKTSKHHLKI